MKQMKLVLWTLVRSNLTFLRRRPVVAALLLALPACQTAFGQGGPPPPPGLDAGGSWAAPEAPAPVTVAVPQLLAGHVPAQIAALGLAPIGPLAPTQQLRLAIGLPLRNQQGLSDLLGELYDPQSPNCRRFLTADEFAQRFGPAESDYAAVVAFAQAHNLVVTATHPNRTLLDVSGSVADIERAFNVNLLLYQHPAEARQFHAPDVEPSVDLAVPLLYISGLNDYALPRPGLYTGSGSGGSFMGYDFREAYVPSATALTGSGQAVALVEFSSDYYTNDIMRYETNAGLPNVTLQKVLIDGYPGINGTTNMGNDEVSLDIEMAISMAPYLNKVVVYEGIWRLWVDVLNRIATDNTARQISSSWFLWGSTSAHQICQQYAAQGQSFFQCSGDGTDFTYAGGANVDPMEEAWLTDVGGTDLTTTNHGGGYISETVWNFGNGYGSGGGYGDDPSLPTSAIPWWQTNAVNATNQASSTYRNVPDVAMVADCLYLTYGDGASTNGAWGTSASAPLWAGFTALVNQQAAENRYPPVGFLNPALYEIGLGTNYSACFHDITTGNNTNSGSHNQHWAVPGYDLCTGWGSPKGTNLINELIKVCDGALSCGQFSGSGFSFNIDFGAAAPAPSPYVYESTSVATTPADWTRVWTNTLAAGFQSYTDAMVGASLTQTQRFYLVECGTNCWRPTGFAAVPLSGHSMQLLANQFDAPANTLDGLFNPMPNTTNQYLPNGAEISIQNTNGAWTFNTYTWNTNGSSGYWTLAGTNVTGNATLSPGQGFWLSNSTPSEIWITFAGLVRQGALSDPIPTTNTWSYSSVVPQAGGLETNLGYSPHTNDTVYVWNPAITNYNSFTYAVPHGGGNPAWSPSEPSLQVGQAFVFAPAVTNTWTRSFSTCQ